MKLHVIILVLSFLSFRSIQAQTDQDAIMMNKEQWCNGISYQNSHWKNYWEGTLKRDNANIGTLTSQTFQFMSNYGISDHLNVLVALPYVWNNTSKGTLHSMGGLQDVSLAIKWKAATIKLNTAKLSMLAVGGISTPMQNYVVDFLPVSIGFGSTNVTARGIIDFQKGRFFTTATAAFAMRSNTQLDRTAYYTDHMIYSNKVAMPNVALYKLSAGLRSTYLIAEASLQNTATLGGFDIRRNDMPFVANKMNATSVGAHLKYTIPTFTHIEVTVDGNYIIKGRNIGQASTFGAGLFYLFNFRKQATNPATH